MISIRRRPQPRHVRSGRFWCAAVVLLCSTPASAQAEDWMRSDLVAGSVVDALRHTGRATVLASFEAPPFDDPGQRERTGEIADEILARALPAGAKLVQRYKRLGLLALSVDARALSAVVTHPAITYVSLDRPGRELLEEASALVGVDTARTRFGVTGAGVRIAVIDSGVDRDHPDLIEGFSAGAALLVLAWVRRRRRRTPRRALSRGVCCSAFCVPLVALALSSTGRAQELPGVVVHTRPLADYQVEFQATESHRISQRDLGYSFEVSVSPNLGVPPEVTLSFESLSEHTEILVRFVEFSEAGTTSDRLLLRQDRRFPFDPDDLVIRPTRSLNVNFDASSFVGVLVDGGPETGGVTQVAGPAVGDLEYRDGILSFLAPLDTGVDFTLGFEFEDGGDTRYEAVFESHHATPKRALSEGGDAGAPEWSSVDPDFTLEVSGPLNNVVTAETGLALNLERDGAPADLRGGDFNVYLDNGIIFFDAGNFFALDDEGDGVSLQSGLEGFFVGALLNGPQELLFNGRDVGGRYFSFAIHIIAGKNTLTGQIVDGSLAPIDTPVGGQIAITGLETGYSALILPEPDGSFGVMGLPNDSMEITFLDSARQFSGAILLGVNAPLPASFDVELPLIGSAPSGASVTARSAVSPGHPDGGAASNRPRSRERSSSRDTVAQIARSAGDVIGEVMVSGSDENATITSVSDVQVPQDTQKVKIAAEIQTVEFPQYSTTLGNPYNDTWRYAWSCAGQTFSDAGRVNITHASSGERTFEHDIDVSAFTEGSGTSCRIEAYTTNIGDGALPTIVNVSVREASPVSITSVLHTAGLFKHQLGTYHMGVSFGSGAPGTRREFKMRILYEPKDAEVTEVEGKIVYGGLEVMLGDNLSFQKIEDGKLEATVRMTTPIDMPPADSNRRATLEVNLTAMVDGTPEQTTDVAMSFKGKGRGVFMPIFETRNITSASLRYGPRSDAEGGDGWGRPNTLDWLHDSPLKFGDVSGEHTWQSGGLSLGVHKDHKGGQHIDARYVDDQGTYGNAMQGDGNGAKIKQVLEAAQSEVQSGAANTPNLLRAVTWILANRSFLDDLAAEPETARIYVGVAEWHQNALLLGKLPNGADIPAVTINNSPVTVGVWNRSNIIQPMPGDHEGHIHVVVR